MFNDNLIILPSSIHEMLFLPASTCDRHEYLKAMVAHVNRTELDVDDILSDNVYYYARNTDKLNIIWSSSRLLWLLYRKIPIPQDLGAGSSSIVNTTVWTFQPIYRSAGACCLDTQLALYFIAYRKSTCYDLSMPLNSKLIPWHDLPSIVANTLELPTMFF